MTGPVLGGEAEDGLYIVVRGAAEWAAAEHPQAESARTENSMSFPIGALLSVSTERLCCPFSELHELIEHLAGGPVWTHQLPDAHDALRPGLLGQHPWLIGLTPPEPFDTEKIVCEWVDEQAARFGAEHTVTVIEGGWSRNPITDLVDKIGADRVMPGDRGFTVITEGTVGGGPGGLSAEGAGLAVTGPRCSHWADGRPVPCPPMCPYQTRPPGMWRRTLFGRWKLRNRPLDGPP